MPNPPEGLPGYGWESLLELAGMATKAMLKQHRREPAPGQAPVGYYWSGHAYVLLYRAADAVALPPLSPGRQRLYDQARTCAECGRKALDPWEKGLDNRRYCPTCQGPVHERLWRQERERDRPAIQAWARGVLADEQVVLAAARSAQWYREVYAADLDGTVLLDAKVRYTTRADPDFMARHPEYFEGSVSPADLVGRVAALAGRRVVTWWPSTDLRDLSVEVDEGGRGRGGVLTTASTDYAGTWYERWVGDLASGSYRYYPTLKPQRPPWEPVEQVTRMRELLAELAGGAGTG